jgi:hypothetical protein
VSVEAKGNWDKLVKEFLLKFFPKGPILKEASAHFQERRVVYGENPST